MKALLAAANQMNSILVYLLVLPPPSYMYARYIDWFEAYLLTYLSEGKKYASNSPTLFNRVQMGEESLAEWNTFLAKVNTYKYQDLEIDS